MCSVDAKVDGKSHAKTCSQRFAQALSGLSAIVRMPPSLFELRRARNRKAAPQRSDGGTKEERDDRRTTGGSAGASPYQDHGIVAARREPPEAFLSVLALVCSHGVPLLSPSFDGPLLEEVASSTAGNRWK
jgi:hypothetical protein